MLRFSQPRSQYRALANQTPGSRDEAANARMVNLEQEMVAHALAQFEPYVRAAETTWVTEDDLDYKERERVADSLQVKIQADSYLSPPEAITLLQDASGRRVVANSLHRQARRHSDRANALVKQLEDVWAALAPYESRYENQALVGLRLHQLRAQAQTAQAHAAYCESAYWSLQRTCEDIASLAQMYDRAGLLPPPVHQD